MGSFRWSSLVLALVLVVACSQNSVRRQSRDGVVLIKCRVADAEVWVDGRFVREMSEVRRGLALAPGVHRIEVRHADYHALYFRVDVGPSSRSVLEADLAARLP